MKGSTNLELKRTIKEEIADIRSILNVIIEFVNHHEKQIDELQMKIEPEKLKMPEEYNWIGHLCKFKDTVDKEWSYNTLKEIDPKNTQGQFIDSYGNNWQQCEVIKSTDSIIYKKPIYDKDKINNG